MHGEINKNAKELPVEGLYADHEDSLQGEAVPAPGEEVPHAGAQQVHDEGLVPAVPVALHDAVIVDSHTWKGNVPNWKWWTHVMVQCWLAQSKGFV